MQIADRFHLHQNLLEAVRGALTGSVPPTVKIPVNTEKSEDETVKKTPDWCWWAYHIQVGRLSPEKVKLYEEIHSLHDAGYSFRKIEKELHCSRNTIHKYLNGDMISVCSSTLFSGVDKYHDQIVRSLSEGKCRSVLYRELQAIGLTCGKTAAYDYFNLVAKHCNIELTPLESCSPEQKQLRKSIQNISISPVKRYLIIFGLIKSLILNPSILSICWKNIR